MELGQRLKRLRKARRDTAQAMADIVGVRRQTWHGWESGLYQPTIEHLAAIAMACNISTDWLILGKGDPP